jgi:superfamily II DNA or RNA helicase
MNTINKKEWFASKGLLEVDYQTRAISECITSLTTQDLPVVLGATPSAGKTLMSIFIANQFINNGAKVLVLTHGTTIIRNNYADSLDKYNVSDNFKYQVLKAGDNLDTTADMVIGLPQSINKKDNLQFDFIIVDEAHERYFKNELQSIIEKVKPKYQLLLTGTPSKFIASTIDYPIHIVSMQEAFQQGRINNMIVEVCGSSYDIRNDDFNTSDDLSTRGDKKLTKEATEATLDNLLNELKKKLTGIFDGKFNSTMQNVFGWNIALKSMKKTMIAANNVSQANHINDYFNSKGIKSLISTHEDDLDSNMIDLFKNNEEYTVLVVVRRGVLGFDMPELVNVIDMTASRNIDRIYQLLSRVARKNDAIDNKYFIKMAVPNTEGIYELIMTAVLCLMSDEYISKFDGRNFGQFDIPVLRREREAREGDGPEGDGQPRGRGAITPVDILGMPTIEFFNKLFHKDGKVLNTFAITTINDVMVKLGMWGDKKIPNGYWTYERCKEEALKYNNRTEFIKGSSGARAAAKNNGWLDDICSHMVEGKKQNGYWTYESCKEEALKYNTRSEFKKGFGGAWGSAEKNGWLDDICSHMVEGKKQNGYWTYERCKEEALKYNTRKEFQKGSSGTRAAAKNNGWLDDICSHMVEVKKQKGYWTYERCKEEALKYNTRSKFQKGSGSAWAAAEKNGWKDYICSHMVEGRKQNNYWTYDRCKEQALKYNTKKEFQKGSGSAWLTAYKNNWLDDICLHMVSGYKGPKKKEQLELA